MAILLSIDHQMRTLEPLKKLTLMADGRWRGLAAIVGRRSGHGPALGLLIQHLLADLGVLPALKRPTISHLSDDQWLAVNTILDEATVRDIIPRLKQAGGEGIVEYPLNKIVL